MEKIHQCKFKDTTGQYRIQNKYKIFIFKSVPLKICPECKKILVPEPSTQWMMNYINSWDANKPGAFCVQYIKWGKRISKKRRKCVVKVGGKKEWENADVRQYAEKFEVTLNQGNACTHGVSLQPFKFD